MDTKTVIQNAMRRAGIKSLEELSFRSGVQIGTINGAMAYDRKLQYETARKLADVLGCAPVDLVAHHMKRNIKNKPRTEMSEQPCWTCRHAVPDNEGHGCNWSERFQPVEGWIAKPVVRASSATYKISYCPQYTED